MLKALVIVSQIVSVCGHVCVSHLVMDQRCWRHWSLWVTLYVCVAMCVCKPPGDGPRMLKALVIVSHIVSVCGHMCVLATWWWTKDAGGTGHCESDRWEESLQAAAGESANMSVHVSDVGRGDAASGVCTLVPSTKQRSVHSHRGLSSLINHYQYD